MLNVGTVVTRELVDDVFGAIVSKHGGWNPNLMPLYIDMVCDRVSDSNNATDSYQIETRKEVIKKLKEIDPILFKRV